MHVGIPTEVHNNESRVAITPAGVRELAIAGHDVTVQSGAGVGSSFGDDDYAAAGATLGTADDSWACEMVLKVKEPIASEYHYLRSGLTLFTYLHLAANEPLTRALLDSDCVSIGYETVQLEDGSLPLLAPMSEIAGRMAILVGAYHLMWSQGGRGVLAAGVPGVRPAKVAVIGAGISGASAVAQAVGMGCDITVLDTSVPRLRQLDALYRGSIKTVASSAHEIEVTCLEADLVVGAVLVTGARAPRLVSNTLVTAMKAGSVLVDIAIDQGGCFEDSHPTTHADPTYRGGNSLFYCVANMPGAVGYTSTVALTNATLPYAVALANKGWEVATGENPALAKGLAVVNGRIFNPPTAHAFPHLPAA